MNKSVFLVASLGLLGFASLATAGKAVEKKKPNCGEKFVLGAHREEGKGLTASQVAAVVDAKLPELQQCWTKTTDVTTKLRFDIDTDGEIQTVQGDLPDEIQRCISVAVVDWRFPEAAQDSSNDYAITFHAAAAVATR